MRGRSSPLLRFVFGGENMSSDRDSLRLLAAFQEIKSPNSRRALIMLVEEMAQKAADSSKEKPRQPIQPAGSLEASAYRGSCHSKRDDKPYRH